MDAASTLVIGHVPLDAATDIGPPAASRQHEGVEATFSQACRDGAEIAAGGRRPKGRCWLFQPTVLRNVHSPMPIDQQEAFEPRP